jgi:uracil phosphoribosyltransferase
LVSLVHVGRHPLLLHKLTRLRDQTTPPEVFRTLVRDLTRLIFLEAVADLRVEDCTVRTPLADFNGKRVADRVGLMPILRAGLGMVEPILDLLPEACVWHLGLYRDHDTLRPVTYYSKLPALLDLDVCLILDPMLATGGSAAAAVEILKAAGARRIKFLGLIAAPEGIEALSKSHPDVIVHVGAIDTHLNDKAYIVPGLGDAGDRQFATC